MRAKLIFLVCCLVISSNILYAQKNSFEIGGKLISKIGGGDYYAPGAGLPFIYKLSNRSGIESGLYFEINPRSFLYVDSLLSYSNKVYREKVIRFPLIYRFDTKIINLSGGFAFDFILNKNKLNANPPIGYKSGDFKSTNWLAVIAISKSISLNRALVLEPEIRSTAPIPDGGVDLGLNISLRKKIF